MNSDLTYSPEEGAKKSEGLSLLYHILVGVILGATFACGTWVLLNSGNGNSVQSRPAYLNISDSTLTLVLILLAGMLGSYLQSAVQLLTRSSEANEPNTVMALAR